MVEPYKAHGTRSRGINMRDEKVVLRQRLAAVNSEWRMLTREKPKRASQLGRLDELRTQRLVLMTELFEFERRNGSTML
jgi:hypothetical protein